MPRRSQALAVPLISLGIGAGIGASLGSTAAWFALVAGVFGIALSFAGSREPSPAAGSPDPPASRPPQAEGLESRVRQVLRLAEQQAEDHRDDARREAERILAAARSQADAIVDAARIEAARVTGEPASGAGDR
jgi:nucleotide-binding universal stress UspA family protein